MKNFTKLLQQQLREKGYLSIDDVIKLSYEQGHYLDTARRKLEEDYTPYSLKEMKGNRIKGWRYLPEKDIRTFEVNQNNVEKVFKKIETKLIQEPLIKFPYINL